MKFTLSFFLFFLIAFLPLQGQKKQTYFVKLENEESSFKKSSSSLHDSLTVWGIHLKSVINNSRTKKSSTTKLSQVYSFRYSEQLFAEIEGDLRQFDEILIVEKEPVVQVLYYPNDPLSNPALPGETGQVALTTHNFYGAWEVEKGDSNVVIGIVDTGIMFEHEDIQANLKYNHNDTIDGINNDGDLLQGDPLIDNYRGWDLADWDNDPSSPAGEDHGLQVTGISSATPDNKLGITGAGFNTKYLPIKTSPDIMPNMIISGYSGILYAAEHGCRVINLSWGSARYPGVLYQEYIDYIVEEYDVVVVAAAGNSGKNEQYYPASFDNVISVTGIRADSTKQDLSTYNYEVDVCAVGWRTKSLRRFSTSSYGNNYGTSFAAPLVSATAALIASNQPTFTSQQIRKQLRVSSLRIDTTAYNLPYQNQMGKMLDPTRAVTDYSIPGLDVYSFSVPDSSSIPSYGGGIDVEITLTNLLASANDVLVKVQSLDSAFVFSQSEFSKINLLQNDFLSIRTKLVAPQNIGGYSVDVPIKVSYIGDNYYDFQIVIVHFEYINCERISPVLSFIQPKCSDNDGRIIVEGLTDGVLYQLNFTIDDISKSVVLKSTNGMASINELGEGDYDHFVMDSLNCKTNLNDHDTLFFSKVRADFNVLNANDLVEGGVIEISHLAPNQEYEISYTYNHIEVLQTKKSSKKGTVIIDHLPVGKYEEVTIDSASCVDFADEVLIIDLIPAVEIIPTKDVELKEVVVIYPNPFENFINITSSFDEFNVEIFSVSGELLLDKKNNNSMKIFLDLSLLPSGSYLIVIHGDSETITQKLMKL